MAKADLTIKTPRGTIINQTSKSGKIEAKLEWNAGFGDKGTGNFTRAQTFMDSEILRSCGPYVPLQTGMLQKSGTLGTVIGTGEVQWIAPYASEQYWNTSETRSYEPQRGGKWFERMKADHGKQIIAEARKMAGR